jgi:hypothetical protein
LTLALLINIRLCCNAGQIPTAYFATSSREKRPEKLKCYPGNPFQPGPIFAFLALAFLVNIRIAGKGLLGTNTLAYFASSSVVKGPISLSVIMASLSVLV